MEYLISRGFRQVSHASVEHLRRSTTFFSESAPFVDHQDDFFVFSNTQPYLSDRSNSQYYLFDGQVFSRDVFLHPFLQPSNKQLQRLNCDLTEKNWLRASGVFTLLKIDANARSFTVHSDPLSQYPIVTWKDRNRYIVSNNALLIEAFLSERGYRLQRNPECHLFAAVAKTNIAGAAPYQGMQYAPPRVMLCCSENIVYRPTLSLAELGEAPGSYKEHIQLCAEGIKQRCKTLMDSRSDYYFLTDVTGGIDSRLVLSALLASGKKEQISAWCNAKYPQPDANVADHILHRYQLKSGPLLHNWHKEWPDYEQKIRRGLFRNRGGRFKDWNALGTGYFPKMIRLGGALGELGRSHFQSTIYSDNSVEHSQLAAELCRRSVESGEFTLLTDKSLSLIHAQLNDTLEHYQQGGIERRNYSNLLYIDTLSRYHFGHQMACSSMAYIAPTLLYDLHLVWANSLLSTEQQQAGKAQFDLMHLLADDDLLRLPMANKRWSANALPVDLRDEFGRIDIIDRNSVQLPMTKEAMQWQFCWPMGDAVLEPPAPPPEWARGKSHAWLQLQRNLNLVEKLTSELSGDNLFFEYFDRDKLIALSQSKPDSISKNSIVAGLSALVGGLMWHLGMEERVQLKDKYTGDYPGVD